jgi:hypothetical protein
VVAAPGRTAFGGGVLNAGAMRLAGGSVTGNQVDGGGGGVAVVREPGSEHGGRLDIGGDHRSVAGAELPTISDNTAEFGGGVAVVDASQWGGKTGELPESAPPDDVPSAILDRGALTGNQASGAGGAVMAYGGSAVGLDGPLTVSASNQAGTAGTDGIAVANAYLRVSGDVRTERGGGVALLKQGWPLTLTAGFTGAGQLVIEQVDGLAAGAAVPAIRLADSAALSPQVESAIVFAIAGIEARLEAGAQGELVVAGYLELDQVDPPGNDVPSKPATPDPTNKPNNPPTSPSPTRQASAPPTGQPPASQPPATRAPASQLPFTDDGQSASPTAASKGSDIRPRAEGSRAEAEDGEAEPPAPEESATASSPSTGTPPAKSATGSASPAAPGAEADSDDGPNLSAPEPPPGLSSKTIGFSLMAFGIFGLAALGVYVMRRGGFFAV